jgi:hypothetical protein
MTPMSEMATSDWTIRRKANIQRFRENLEEAAI